MHLGSKLCAGVKIGCKLLQVDDCDIILSTNTKKLEHSLLHSNSFSLLKPSFTSLVVQDVILFAFAERSNFVKELPKVYNLIHCFVRVQVFEEHLTEKNIFQTENLGHVI